MSLTLPLEDLNRLQVSAQFSKDGFPELSLNLKPIAPRTESSESYYLPSGVLISFQRSISEDGCWSLSMAACCQGLGPSLLLRNQHVALTDSTGTLPNFMMNTPSSESNWLSSAIGMSQLNVPSMACQQDSPQSLNNPGSTSPYLSSPLGTSPTVSAMADITMPMTTGQPTSSTSTSGSGSSQAQEITNMLTGDTAMYSQPQYSTLSSALSSIEMPSKCTALTCSPGSSSLAPSIDEELSDNNVGEHSELFVSNRDEGERNRREGEYSARTPVRRKKDLPCFDRHCYQRFMSEHTRRRHMSVHQEKLRKLFFCTQGCTEKFSRQHDRFRHEVSQHGLQSDWTCETCRGFFSSEKSLSNHKCTTSRSKRWKIGVPKTQKANSNHRPNEQTDTDPYSKEVEEGTSIEY